MAAPARWMDASKPSSLRLAGFLCLAFGGLVLGIGSLMTWAVVGVNGSHALDSLIKGTDVWEGKVTLAVAVAALVGMLAVRLVTSGSSRRLIAVAITIGGLFATGLAIGDAIRVKSRFTSDLPQLERIAKGLSAALRRPVVEILTELQQRLTQLVSVTRGTGLWLVIAGGTLTAVGGALTMAWANGEAGRLEGGVAAPVTGAEAPEGSMSLPQSPESPETPPV